MRAADVGPLGAGYYSFGEGFIMQTMIAPPMMPIFAIIALSRHYLAPAMPRSTLLILA